MNPVRIDLTGKCDHLKGNWFEWYCTADMPDGTTQTGTVQADGGGEMIAFDSFQSDDL